MSMSSPSTLRLLHLPCDDKENIWDSTFADEAEHVLLCSHALVQGKNIFGTVLNGGEDWISWKTTLDHSIGQITSNEDGTIVAASTMAGSVALLSGKDGRILATRMVSKNKGVANIDFAATSGADTLIITVYEESDKTCQIILVSNIDGTALNQDDTVIDATRKMTINAVNFPIKNVLHIKASYLEMGTIRFALITYEGELFIFDFDNIQVTLVRKEDFSVHPGAGVALQHHSFSNTGFFVFCIVNSKHEQSLAWYNVNQLSVDCQMSLNDSPILLSPLRSCIPQASLAIAVVSRNAIQVIQVCIKEEQRQSVIHGPHLIFQIPTTCSTLAFLNLPYSFRYLGSGDMIREFTPYDIVGRIRLLTHQNSFDNAQDLLARLKHYDQDYSQFHPSEISLRRLEFLLGGKISPETMNTAQLCLQVLVNLDANELAVSNLLRATDVVMDWHAPTIKSFQFALRLTSQIIRGAEVHPTAMERIGEKLQKIDTTIQAMDALIVLLDNEDAPLETPFNSVRDISGLLIALLTEGLSGAANALYRSNKYLTPEHIVSAIVSLPPSSIVNPRNYVELLLSGISGLSVNHKLLPTIVTWTCRTADSLFPDLDSGIFLLVHVHRAMNQLKAKAFASFASFCPFVESNYRILSPRNIEVGTSFRSSDSGMPLSIGKHKKILEQAVPTILELGRLKGGAIKHHKSAIQVDEDDCDDIAIKLRHAKILQKAVELGMRNADLRKFVKIGGTKYLALELVKLYSRDQMNENSRMEQLHEKILPFCRDAEVSFDDILIQYSDQLCDSIDITQSLLIEASSIARCCIHDASKCKITLTILRAALLCGTSSPCIGDLSRDAISWAAGDLTMQSELTEATRLLVINAIVVSYCGRDAALELFRVDNPSHAIKLLSYVCRHVAYPNALSDAFTLCNAFTHLSKEDACIQLLESSIISGPVESCASVMCAIFSDEAALAMSVWERVLEFCSLTLFDCCKIMRDSNFRKSDAEYAKSLSSKALLVLETVQEHISSNALKSTSFEHLLDSFQRVQRLQLHHDIFISPLELSDLQVPTSIVCSLISSIRKKFGKEGEDTQSHFEQARRATQLLVGTDKFSSVWFPTIGYEACNLILTNHDCTCHDGVKFLVESGTLSNLSDSDAAEAVLSVLVKYCNRASQGDESFDEGGVISKMKLTLGASQLLHDYVLTACPSMMLSRASSLSSVTETIDRILMMADNGVGDELNRHSLFLKSWNQNYFSVLSGSESNSKASFKKPILHSEWYVGDGLLLPLEETHVGCVAFCLDSMGLILFKKSSDLQVSQQLHYLLTERGAHAMALRIGCLTMANVLTCSFSELRKNVQYLASFARSFQSTLKFLAERSLGGSGNGITNPKVDSGLALSYLHLLPTKWAFQVYKGTLPSAVTKRDFNRMMILSNIGIVAGKGIEKSLEKIPFSWKKQEKFVDQCERLSLRTRWWLVLHQLKVEFEPRRFDSASDSTTADGSSRNETNYTSTLVRSIVESYCNEIKDPDAARRVALSFAQSFGIDKQFVAQEHIGFILSCPKKGREFTSDIRLNLALCEESARVSLKDLVSPMKRAFIVRSALLSLEENTAFAQDYERHCMFLSLYNEQLIKVLDTANSKFNIDPKSIEEELECIERRRDTLAVLMSFFDGELLDFRPDYPKFFTPISSTLGCMSIRCNRMQISVLGPYGLHAKDSFDPLAPLHLFFTKHTDASVATALAPLCIPLSIPVGYIHVRSLLARFELSSRKGGPLPNLEIDVLPVINRLKSPMDQSEVMEWCASRYDEKDDAKMRCLELALEYAMKASSEIEHKAGRATSEDYSAQENCALQRVRRLSSQKSILADKKNVQGILFLSKCGDVDNLRVASQMIDDLRNRLNEELWERPDINPDMFLELFLTESSAIAATACLSIDTSFALDHLRYMATVVHKVCKDISEQYTHVQHGATCRRLARRWLIHGDVISTSIEEKPIKSKAPSLPVSVEEDEDETVNFIMDLNGIEDAHHGWSEDVGSTLQDQFQVRLVTREEEPSALNTLGCAREISEFDCSRAALRIAFVMSFAEDYHPKDEESSLNGNFGNDSILGANTSREEIKKRRRGLLSKVPKRESNHDSLVIEHGRELLRVVFASSRILKERSIVSSINSVTSCTTHDLGITAATFAMRYRALKTAAILCPQEALEVIIREEDFLSSSNGDNNCNLSQCTFGAFVAKEIEEMGLSLPYSELTQLSTMQFSSYARALRRNHDSNSLKTKGRLLLLLIEMSTVPGSNLDVKFLVTVLTEMCQAHLPRSLLHAAERCMNMIENTHLQDSNSALMHKLVECVALLVRVSVKDAAVSLSEYGSATLFRIASLVQRVRDIKVDLIDIFIEGLSNLLALCAEEQKSSLLELIEKLKIAKPYQSLSPDSTLISLRDRLQSLHLSVK